MVAVRGVVGGGFGQASEIDGFGQTYVGSVFAEKIPAGRLNAVIASAVRDGVQIKLQYLIFGKFFLNFQGQNYFFYFSGESFVGGQEGVFDQLLADGGAALS